MVSCGDSGSSSGNSDVEITEDSLVIEIIDRPKYNVTVANVTITGELTEGSEDCPSDNNRTGKIVWNSNTDFYYEVCDGYIFIFKVARNVHQLLSYIEKSKIKLSTMTIVKIHLSVASKKVSKNGYQIIASLKDDYLAKSIFKKGILLL